MYRIIFLIALLCMTMVGFSQPDNYAKALMNTPYIAFEEQPVSFKDKTGSALTILIIADQDAYAKEFKNWLKTKYAIEGKKNLGYLSSPKTLLPDWSADSLFVNYKIEKDTDASRLFLILESKKGFLSEKDNADVMVKVKAALTEQVKAFYVKYYDEKISDQQKFYDLQLSDLAKTNKRRDRTIGDIQDNNDKITKNNSKIRETEAAINSSDGKIKSLNAQLQHEQKASEQAKKEVDAQQKLIETKEAEYNKLNAAGTLNTKEGERAIKDLEKLRSKQEKLQSTLTKATEAVTSSENAVLKEEQNKTKLNSKLDEYKRDTENHESKIRDLKREQESMESSIKDEQLQVDAAKADLEKLKAAKLNLSGTSK